jgi:excisionase family DNA binding protein
MTTCTCSVATLDAVGGACRACGGVPAGEQQQRAQARAIVTHERRLRTLERTATGAATSNGRPSHAVPVEPEPDVAGLATKAVASMVPSRDRLLTAEQTAERFQVPVAQVYRLARSGKLPAVRIGRYRRFRVAEIEAWEAEGGS